MPVWYGPGAASFQVQFPGNPYDYEKNDVRVLFTGEKGDKFERLAYFDNGFWRAHLVAPKPGKYQATLIRNGKASLEAAEEGQVVLDAKLPRGYIRKSEFKNRFQFDNGELFFPIGFNLAWQGADAIPYQTQIPRMSNAGLTWTRVWACHWDKKNPWWPQSEDYALKGQLWPEALDTWGSWIDSLDRNGVAFQMVLFHHGAFSSQTDANWPDHPWNEAKGGFLKAAPDFFTNPQAKKLTKMWLRYAVARWAHSPNLMAWELFNEVEWTDAAREGKWKEIGDWHAEMGVYIRSIDPYKHLITTSGAVDHPDLYEAMDFWQPHLYGKDVPDRLGSLTVPETNFIGEFGVQEELAEGDRAFLREAVWSSLLANQSAAAMYWYWDRVEAQNLYPELRAWASVVNRGRIADHPDARRLSVTAGDQQAQALGTVDWLMVRLKKGGSVRLAATALADGSYDAVVVDLTTGNSALAQVSLNGFVTTISGVPEGESVVILKRR